MINGDECKIFAYNSRLDTLQAIVGNHLFNNIEYITKQRISNAKYLDNELNEVPEITIPNRVENAYQVFHIYVIKAKEIN